MLEKTGRCFWWQLRKDRGEARATPSTSSGREPSVGETRTVRESLMRALVETKSE